MCAASICQALSCDATIFAIDPSSGQCVPLSGCFLTAEQQTWQSCSQDPCRGLDENSCIADTRCQPAYANPTITPAMMGMQPASTFTPPGTTIVAIACAVSTPIVEGGPTPTPNTFLDAPGVNNGSNPKHPVLSHSGCFSDTARVYTGCRAAPTIAPLPACETLSANACSTRRDCTTTQPTGTGPNGVGEASPPVPTPAPPENGPALGVGKNPLVQQPTTSQCFTLVPMPPSDCSQAEDSTSCLLNPTCQSIGTNCYCPPGSTCSCTGGTFLGCELNDRLRRCQESSDCNSGQRCDNDEACITPRTFSSVATDSAPTPGEPGCVGACVPAGCVGMGEQMCNAHLECDGGSYGTVCKAKPYCAGQAVPLTDGSNVATMSSAGACGCDSEFVACADQVPVDNLHVERSLLVRDPEIIDDPSFRLDTVFSKLAPAGNVDAFTSGFLKQVGAANTLPNGSSVTARDGWGLFLTQLAPDTAGVTQRLAGLLHITALINRLDLAQSETGTCGEARLSYALTLAYNNGNQRMTLIVELHVPDDGNGCRTVAQRWAELSLYDNADDRRTALIALYNELLSPATLGQVRTNEFLNSTGAEPWQLREFHLDQNGMLQAAAVAQTVDPSFANSPDFLAWLQQNSAAVLAGNAVFPAQYLAAGSVENGTRLSLSGMPDIEKAVNAQACAGCHLTETGSPFVHIGERLGEAMSGSTSYQPIGRAVIDSFMETTLLQRAQNLQTVLSSGTQALLNTAGRTGLARVH
jgi:hypothetical protein